MSRNAPSTSKKSAGPQELVKAPLPPIHCSGNIAERVQRIALAAYYRAERRGFQGGDPVADWLEAEAEVDAELNSELH